MTLPKGYTFAGVKAGLKRDGYDVALVRSEPKATVAAVYTRNKLVAAPVIYCKENDKHPIEALIVNSKNANAATGKQGMRSLEAVVKEVAKELGCKKENVLMSSTGVIGQILPHEKIIEAIPALVGSLTNESENNAPEAIRTTDKYKKTVYKTMKIGAKEGRFFAMAKGAGMIHPNMATMLVYIFTDIAIERSAMKLAFKTAIDKTLNRISVDGDTSTNDSAMIFSNGALENTPIKKTDKAFVDFSKAVEAICLDVAKLIVADGEGATKLVSLRVRNALDKKSAFDIAKSIATSNLVKTAFFGCDANWGRILTAAGYGSEKFDPEKATLTLNGFTIYRKGNLPKLDVEKLDLSMKEHEQTVVLDLGHATKIDDVYYFSDLSHDYVDVNSAYRT